MQLPAIAPPRHGTQARLPRPTSVLGETAGSFPFSVAGGLRRRLERHYELYGKEAVVERFNYMDLRGKPQPILRDDPRHEPRSVLEPTVAPPPAAPPPVALPPVAPPQVTAPVPSRAPESVASAAPVLPTPAPAAPVAPATLNAEPGWHIVEPKPFNLLSRTTELSAPANGVSNAWHVIDAPANLPAVSPEWNAVDVPGVLTETASPETQALTELSKTSVRTVILNAAIWATVLTAIFAAIEAFAGHH